jgi:phytanoyl-CoA hydroxylase
MSLPHGPMNQAFRAEDTTTPGAKVLDTVMLFPEGDDLSFSLPLSMFLQELFSGPALAFQSLHFEVGSTQAVHQDTAYVVVDDQPMQMVASWIALEDVQPGSGELVYHAGGHRLPDFPYGGGESKHFNFTRDGNDTHVAHLKYLAAESARLGHEQRSFLPKKGDLLVWHADLPHGGGQITSPGLTRRSLVTHYCPARLSPHYLQFMTQENQRKVATPSSNFMCSMYYPTENFGVEQSTKVRS